MSLRETYTQKVALTPRKNLQLLEGAFYEKGGAKGSEAVFITGSEEVDTSIQRFWGVGVSSVSNPFARKWLKSSREKRNCPKRGSNNAPSVRMIDITTSVPKRKHT